MRHGGREFEQHIGAATTRQVEREYVAVGDPGLTWYLERVASRVSRAAAPDRTFRFHLVEDPDPKDPIGNAFAVPDGSVFVTLKLLTLMASEAELACVLGHELAHVTKRHGVERFRLLMGAGAGPLTPILATAFSQEEEKEADAFGTAYAARAGYDPRGMLDVLKRFKEFEKARGPGGYFRSHPLAEDRMDHIAAAVRLMLKHEVAHGDRDLYHEALAPLWGPAALAAPLGAGEVTLTAAAELSELAQAALAKALARLSLAGSGRLQADPKRLSALLISLKPGERAAHGLAAEDPHAWLEDLLAVALTEEGVAWTRTGPGALRIGGWHGAPPSPKRRPGTVPLFTGWSRTALLRLTLRTNAGLADRAFWWANQRLRIPHATARIETLVEGLVLELPLPPMDELPLEAQEQRWKAFALDGAREDGWEAVPLEGLALDLKAFEDRPVTPLENAFLDFFGSRPPGADLDPPLPLRRTSVTGWGAAFGFNGFAARWPDDHEWLMAWAGLERLDAPPDPARPTKWEWGVGAGWADPSRLLTVRLDLYDRYRGLDDPVESQLSQAYGQILILGIPDYVRVHGGRGTLQTRLGDLVLSAWGSLEDHTNATSVYPGHQNRLADEGALRRIGASLSFGRALERVAWEWGGESAPWLGWHADLGWEAAPASWGNALAYQQVTARIRSRLHIAGLGGRLSLVGGTTFEATPRLPLQSAFFLGAPDLPGAALKNLEGDRFWLASLAVAPWPTGFGELRLRGSLAAAGGPPQAGLGLEFGSASTVLLQLGWRPSPSSISFALFVGSRWL